MAASTASRPWSARLLNESQFLTETGELLYRKVWRPSQKVSNGRPPFAVLFIAHGAAEHCERYEVLAHALAEQNILVFGHDHVGHGRSTGARFQIDDFRMYVRDALADIQSTMLAYPKIPLFMFGSSMGGLITLLSALEKPGIFRGIVLSAPAIVPDPATATPCKVCMARCFAKRCPDFGVGKMPRHFITRDAEQLRILEADPLVYHKKAKARWAVRILDEMNAVSQRLGELQVPFLCTQGAQDQMTTATGARLLQDQAARLSPHSTVKIYDNMVHDLLHDIQPDAQRVLNDMVTWVLNVIGRRRLGSDDAVLAMEDSAV